MYIFPETLDAVWCGILPFPYTSEMIQRSNNKDCEYQKHPIATKAHHLERTLWSQRPRRHWFGVWACICWMQSSTRGPTVQVLWPIYAAVHQSNNGVNVQSARFSSTLCEGGPPASRHVLGAKGQTPDFRLGFPSLGASRLM